ncbi:cache domain-containing protein, partial [Marinomonas fungiae]|uniref:cache domain-containing protein n=1 Tax=Marinomonas fungiae TaxID=1137284 RepID=UPI003A9538A2
MTVRAKIIALVAAGVILPVLLVSLVIISSVRTDAVDKFGNQSKAEISYVDALFSMYLNNLAENAAFFARSDVITELTFGSLERYADQPAKMMTPESNSVKEQRAFSLLDDFGQTHPDLAYIWAGLEDKGYLSWPKGKSSDNYDPTKRSWYKAAQGSVGAVRIPAYLDAFTGAPVVDYVHNFTGADGVKGVVGIDVTLQGLTGILKTVKFGGEGYVVMVEDTGTILADPADPENNFRKLAEASRPYSSLDNSDSVQS